MTISPASPSTGMGLAFAEVVRSFRGLEGSNRPMSSPDFALLRLFAEEAIAIGVSAFDATLRFDASWRTSVFRGEIPYDAAIESLIGDNIRMWVENGESLLESFDRPTLQRVDLPDFEPIRSRVAAGRAMITPDDEFFEGEGLDELTAQAIDEDERGLTVEFGTMVV
jgi:hypothetical protein